MSYFPEVENDVELKFHVHRYFVDAGCIGAGK
jgi:hypothetical protein